MWWAPLLNNIAALLGNGGGAANSYESIATVTLGSDSSGITFSSIPSTYKHLQIRGIGKSATTTNGPSLYFNNVTSGSQYAWHSLTGNGNGNVNAGGYSSQAYISSGNLLYSGQFTAFIYDFLDYADTNKYKTVKWLSGVDTNGVSNVDSSVWLSSGLWQSTSAINRIDLFNGYNWKAGTTFALYGVKG